MGTVRSSSRMMLLSCFFAFIAAVTLMLTTGCGRTTAQATKPDFADAAAFETALNNGDDVKGKTVTFKVNELVPNSALGYNLQAGEHLNFVSAENPGIKAGETVTVKVTKVESMLKSWIIAYEKL